MENECGICLMNWKEKDNQFVNCPFCKTRICIQCVLQCYRFHKRYEYLERCPFCRKNWIRFITKIYKKEEHDLWIFESEEEYENRITLQQNQKCVTKMCGMFIMMFTITFGTGIYLYYAHPTYY